MGTIEDLGFHYRPLERAVPVPPPKPEPGAPSDRIIDELIDQEVGEWSSEEADKQSVGKVAPVIERMIGPQTSDSGMRRKVAERLATAMVKRGVNANNETSIKRMVIEMAQRAGPLKLGGMHPVFRAYAYGQTVKNGGAYR